MIGVLPGGKGEENGLVVEEKPAEVFSPTEFNRYHPKRLHVVLSLTVLVP